MAVSCSAVDIVRRFQRAKAARGQWESHWRECYAYALPQRGVFADRQGAGGKHHPHLYDGTATDAVEQLAASLMAHVTPPWARWFGVIVGEQHKALDDGSLSALLESSSAALQAHFDRSNFLVAMHECYLDLVTAGTACLMFEEAEWGSASAFHFSCVPLQDVVFEEDARGHLAITLRRRMLTESAFRRRYPHTPLPSETMEATTQERRVTVIDMVAPCSDGEGYDYTVVFESASDDSGIIEQGHFYESPFLNFRWLKAAGDIYGRSPVMKALPEIKTANKVVELILKNASIAVTGIWQAEDDGVLNPANVRLQPGTIIPKALGSKGLTPLSAPGRFDVSQLMLADLRARIREALLVAQLGLPADARMTATEVLERSVALVRLLGATYGRLQCELLAPLIRRGLGILRRRGVIESIRIDGDVVELQYHAPLARAQRRLEAQNVLLWLDAVRTLGDSALATVNLAPTVRWLGERLGVPQSLMVTERQQDEAREVIEQLAEAEVLANGEGLDDT